MQNSQTQHMTENSVLENVTAIPQTLAVDPEENFIGITNNVTEGETINGMVVYNKLDTGSIAYAATPDASIEGEEVQRFICSINSNHAVPSTRTFDFSLKPPCLGEERDNQLFLQVLPGIVDSKLAKRDFLYNEGNDSNLIPLLVGPGAISLAKPLTPDEMKALGCKESAEIDLTGLLNGVVSAVPVLARHGLQIYEELQQSTNFRNANSKNDIRFFIGLKSIANAALPLAGALISG